MAEIKVTKKEMSKILNKYNSNKNNQSEGSKMQDIKSPLTNLNEFLLEQLIRITNEDLKGEELNAEINRAKSVTETAKTIIDNSQLALNAAKFLIDNGYTFKNNNALRLLGECEDE